MGFFPGLLAAVGCRSDTLCCCWRSGPRSSGKSSMEVLSLPRGVSSVFLRRNRITTTFSHKVPRGSSIRVHLFLSTFTPKITSVTSCAARKKKNSNVEPVFELKSLQELVYEAEEVEEDYVGEEIEEDEILEGDFEDFEDDIYMEEDEPYVGDGGGGGGMSLCGKMWDKKVLALAEEVSVSFDGDLKIFAFKTSANQLIQVRIEKLSSKYGSPTMADIENFSSAYRARLEEAVSAGTIPENFSLEVSSPGVERVVRIPDDLERFKDRPMLVKYIIDNAREAASSQESEGIFKLLSFDVEIGYCTWGVADVRINRERAGKGRPLSKKQREWKLQTPFTSLRLVRLYSEC